MSLFDVEIPRACSIASMSQVRIHRSVDDPRLVVPPTNQDGQEISVFDLKKSSHRPTSVMNVPSYFNSRRGFFAQYRYAISAI